VNEDDAVGHPYTEVRARVGYGDNLDEEKQAELKKQNRFKDTDPYSTAIHGYDKRIVMHPFSQYMDFEHELDHVKQHEAMSQLLNEAFSSSDQEGAVGSLLGMESANAGDLRTHRARRIVNDQRWLGPNDHFLPTAWENLTVDEDDEKRVGGSEVTRKLGSSGSNSTAWNGEAEEEEKKRDESADGTAETLNHAENKLLETHAYVREYQRQSDRQAPDARLAFQAHRVAENMPDGNDYAPLGLATIDRTESSEHHGTDEKAPTIAQRYQQYVDRGGHAAERTPVRVRNSPQSGGRDTDDKAVAESALPTWLNDVD
jgi:hypothetical protein